MLSIASCGDVADEVETDASVSYDASATAPDAAGVPDAATFTDAAGDADAGAPAPLTFRLAYAPSGPGPVYEAIYIERDCVQRWVSVIDGDGNVVPIDSDCGLCRCDACDACAVCDCAWLIEPIEADAHRDHAWDGITHPTIDQAGCGICETDDTLPPGDYKARFCYSWSSDGSGERVCADEAFSYPSVDGAVIHTVTGM